MNEDFDVPKKVWLGVIIMLSSTIYAVVETQLGNYNNYMIYLMIISAIFLAYVMLKDMLSYTPKNPEVWK